MPEGLNPIEVGKKLHEHGEAQNEKAEEGDSHDNFTDRHSRIVQIGEAILLARVQFDVIQLGKHPYVILPAYEGLDVVKRGVASILTTGTVEHTDMTYVLEVDGKRVRFGGDSVFSIRAPADATFAVAGDSGSLVIDAASGAARGLLLASGSQPGGWSHACDLRAVMEELGCETPCTGGLGGMIRRAIFRRSTTAFEAARPHSVGTTGPGKKNAFLDDVVRRVDRFRHRFLDGGHGHWGGVIGETLSLLAVDLSEAVYADEDVAGLIDAALPPAQPVDESPHESLTYIQASEGWGSSSCHP